MRVSRAFIGKHLRFSDDDIAQIMAEGARPAGDPCPRHPAVAAVQARLPDPGLRPGPIYPQEVRADMAYAEKRGKGPDRGA